MSDYFTKMKKLFSRDCSPVTVSLSDSSPLTVRPEETLYLYSEGSNPDKIVFNGVTYKAVKSDG